MEVGRRGARNRPAPRVCGGGGADLFPAPSWASLGWPPRPRGRRGPRPGQPDGLGLGLPHLDALHELGVGAGERRAVEGGRRGGGKKITSVGRIIHVACFAQ